MKYLSERIGVEKTPEGLTVRIAASTVKDKKDLLILKGWVILWLLCGVLLLGQTMVEPNADIKVYLLVFLAFWAYFAMRVTKGYYFKKYGVEIIHVHNGKVMYSRSIKSKLGKPQFLVPEGNSPFAYLGGKSNFTQVYYDSFWISQGGNLSIGEGREQVRFGLQLPREESEPLAHLLNRYWKQSKTNRKE